MNGDDANLKFNSNIKLHRKYRDKSTLKHLSASCSQSLQLEYNIRSLHFFFIFNSYVKKRKVRRECIISKVNKKLLINRSEMELLKISRLGF